MKIDGNELAILQNDLDREGKKEEALKIKLEFLRQVRESGDHCPCKEACRHHGNEVARYAVAMGRACARLAGTEMASLKKVYEVYETTQVYVL